MEKDLVAPGATIRGEDDFRQETLEMQRSQLIEKSRAYQPHSPPKL